MSIKETTYTATKTIHYCDKCGEKIGSVTNSAFWIHDLNVGWRQLDFCLICAKRIEEVLYDIGLEMNTLWSE